MSLDKNRMGDGRGEGEVTTAAGTHHTHIFERHDDRRLLKRGLFRQKRGYRDEILAVKAVRLDRYVIPSFCQLTSRSWRALPKPGGRGSIHSNCARRTGISGRLYLGSCSKYMKL